YVGTGDHLFQYGHDPDDEEFYGYYYYDSTLNAASYNQTDGRFYVYDYLERTSDAEKQDPPSYSDFLPFNSPYANTNGKATGSYTYNGVHNEYVGTSHISYDSKYNTENNSTNRVITNYLFGMSMEMDFYLPAVPGTQDGDGVWGNQSIVGDDMVFEFSGDDDVWVLIDGKLALDIGGIHGVETGSIDFSTGVVTNNGVVDQEKSAYLKTLQGGSHKLTMYYLERGSSLSNFKLRFNLTTRYAMTLRKEDTLNAHLLNGARFAVYTDSGCSKPAQLWNSREEHESGAASTNEFTVRNGVASMWGLAAGNTYYLVETLGPDSMSNVPSKGIIRMRLNNSGLPDYDVLEDKDGNLTVGYTVHGYKVSEDQQEAYLTITNTDATDSEPTEVTVSKVWQDDVNHDRDSVTAYLHANGTRIQSATLSKENNWTHTWTNLPKTDRDGNPVSYTVREATIPGYVGHIEPVKGNAGSSSGGNTVTTPSEGFADGKTYLLQTQYGYIGSDSAGIRLEKNLSTAENSLDTQWVVTVNSNGTYTFTNKDGKTLFYDNYMYKISSGPGQYKNLNFSGGKLSCYIDHGNWNETQYPKEENMESNVIHNHVFYTTTNSSESFTVTPLQIGVPEPEPDPEPEEPEEPDTELYYEYRITNIPAKDATISLKVNKLWDPGELGGSAIYNDKTIEVVLLENGAEAGLSGTLSLRNGWSYTFESLPKYDSNDKEIAYSVKETNPPDGWHAEYGTVGSVNGSETAYEITVTNVYHMNVILPSTGGIGPYGHIILGLSIMLGSLGWYYGQRRKSERRECREK
ncbi:MAG: Cna B-type domain-containing protein, partial [Clostridia bacterium]|nr:Cna B-type domain-containing protein [Clostridia bacterium]